MNRPKRDLLPIAVIVTVAGLLFAAAVCTTEPDMHLPSIPVDPPYPTPPEPVLPDEPPTILL